MKEINILPPQIYNLLAAGEVVESPASIVKEAVENSLDADASSIEISILNSGLAEITITDNGRGCEESQIDKVFLPHATSKISKAKDIESISTLGFRGEALSSIASVSKVEFVSRTKSEPMAARIELHGGEIIAKGKIGANIGTRLTVRNLFYNVPARKKFLRKATAETNNITNTVQKLILANPAVSFKYTTDDETIYNYKGSSLLDAITLLYGKDTAEKILPVHHISDGMELNGYISVPSFKKHNRTWQTVMINNRAIESGTVGKAANEAFSNYMVTGSFPFFVLNLTVNPAIVDVNVHPRKAEVKFSNDAEVFDFAKTAIVNCIDMFLSTDFKVASSCNDKPVEKPIYDDEYDKKTLQAVKFLSSAKTSGSTVQSAPNVLSLLEKMHTYEQQTALSKAKPSVQIEAPTVRDKGFDVRIVGTIFDCYVLIVAGSELFILDQHAAHERLLFDELQQQIDNGKVITQQLLEPSLLYLTPQEMTRMTEAAPHLEKMGVTCAPFGANCFRITAVPVSILPHGIDTVIANVLREVKSAPPSRLSELVRDRLIMDCCKNAIKAGQHLSTEQIHAFLRQFRETKITPACPHGRPIFIKLTKKQIEKMFSRK